MSDKDAATPRVYLIRHGQTEWSRNGRYTGTTDLPLLPAGEDKIRQTASAVFGPHKLIDPKQLLKVYCSPRQRAQRTLELLLESAGKSSTTNGDSTSNNSIDIETTEDVREWTYADYEGLKTHEIVSLRKQRGHNDTKLRGGKWDLWQTGSEGPDSETPDQVAARVDNLIAQIVQVHGRYLDDVRTGDVSGWHGKRDILVVAHGHILRAFVKRWVGSDMGSSINLMLEPGGVCGLSYAHGNVEERAVLVGMSFPQAQ